MDCCQTLSGLAYNMCSLSGLPCGSYLTNSHAYSRFQFITNSTRLVTLSASLKGIFCLTCPAHTVYTRFGFMASQWLFSVGVMLVFGLVFAVVDFALVPGKESWLFLLAETRWPLSPEDLICSKDVSLMSLNHWKCSSPYDRYLPFSVEASASPQADFGQNLSSWTSGHVSTAPADFATANCCQSVCLPCQQGVAQVGQTQVSLSLWTG